MCSAYLGEGGTLYVVCTIECAIHTMHSGRFFIIIFVLRKSLRRGNISYLQKQLMNQLVFDLILWIVSGLALDSFCFSFDLYHFF